LFNRIIRRAILDLKLLRSSIGGYRYFAAGIPWFVTLFGRDSLVTALLTLAIAPDMTADTLRLLACLQGQRVNKDTDEEPGKIPHELRLGEMARTRQIPHTPSYSTIDATIIFLILLVRHAWWTGSLNLFMELQENIEHALTWMNTYGDIDGDGYLEYRNGTYLENQGWKDSGDGILSLDGQPVQAPIALVEVQGFAYMARFDLADLYVVPVNLTRLISLSVKQLALKSGSIATSGWKTGNVMRLHSMQIKNSVLLFPPIRDKQCGRASWMTRRLSS
jgi:glycogen debranching enzyme